MYCICLVHASDLCLVCSPASLERDRLVDLEDLGISPIITLKNTCNFTRMQHILHARYPPSASSATLLPGRAYSARLAAANYQYEKLLTSYKDLRELHTYSVQTSRASSDSSSEFLTLRYKRARDISAWVQDLGLRVYRVTLGSGPQRYLWDFESSVFRA